MRAAWRIILYAILLNEEVFPIDVKRNKIHKTLLFNSNRNHPQRLGSWLLQFVDKYEEYLSFWRAFASTVSTTFFAEIECWTKSECQKKKLARFNGEMRKTAPSYIFFLFNFFCFLDHKTTRVQFTNRKNYWLKES